MDEIFGAEIEEVGAPEYKSFGNFRMSAKGLHWIEKSKAGDGEEKETWLAAPFEVLALTRDQGGASWGKLLRWYDPDGRRHEWAMPAAMLGGDRGELWRELLDGGLEIASAQSARNRLADYLSSVRVTRRARAVERIGWHHVEGSLVFALPDRVFGESAERVLLQSEARIADPYQVSGTLEQWRDEIGSKCAGNSRLVLAVSAAFAAPLLELIQDGGGGFHFVGTSQTGKTTALLVAGSVWGGGLRRGFLDTWRATANGLEGVAAAHCDALLALDEMSEVSPQEASEAAYMVANGNGKARASRTGAARRRAEWRVMLLSSGEVTLADKLAEIGRRVRAGQEVRIVDVPADAGAGMGAFEDLHGAPSGGGFADELRRATSRLYGAPIRAFLTALAASLAADRPGLIRQMRQFREDFLRRHLPADAGGQARSVCARFALAALGGKLATLAGLTGWAEDEAERAAARCFADWIGNRGSAGDGEIEAAIRQVRAFVEAHGASRFEAAWMDSPERIVNRAGFRRLESGTWQYMILPEAWRTEVCKGFNAAAVAREMVARGLLLPGNDGKSSRKTDVPRQGKLRLYCLTAGVLDDTIADRQNDGGTGGTGGTTLKIKENFGSTAVPRGGTGGTNDFNNLDAEAAHHHLGHTFRRDA